MRPRVWPALLIATLSILTLLMVLHGRSGTSTGPARASTPPPGGCLQWDIRGVWQTQQGNGYNPVMSFTQNGTALTGMAMLTAAEAARAGYSGTTGSLTGSLSGNQIDIVVTWPPRANGTVPRGRYTGTVSAGRITGSAVGLDSPGSASASWNGTGPANCVDAVGGPGFSATTRAGVSTPSLAERAALKLYYHTGRADYFSTATVQGEHDAQAGGYVYLGVQGHISTVQRSGMVPLKLYFGPARGDYFSTATSTGESNALAAGYHLVRIEGYVYPAQQSGTIALRLWYHDTLGDNFTASSATEESTAQAAGYRYVRVECYIWPSGTATAPPPAPASTPTPTPTPPPAPSPSPSPSPSPTSTATPAATPTPPPDFDVDRPKLPPRLGTELGPIDLAAYCRAGASRPVPPETGDGEWWCAASEDDYWLAEPNYVCRQTYNDPIAVARLRDPNDPNSWVCYHGEAQPPPKPSAPGWPDPYAF